jgi:hypothetical protein
MAQEIINVGESANDGSGESLRSAFQAVNNNFTQIWSAGPVNTNVVISGNTVTVTGVNNNLVLAGNGIGNVQVNSSLVPGIDGVYDIGDPNARVNTVYATYFVGNGSQLTGVGGGGSGSSIANGVSNVSIADVSGPVTIRVGPTPNIVVITSTALTVTGNITGNYVFGNGAFLTGIASPYGNANVAAYLPTNTANVGAGNVSATGNVRSANLIATGNIFVGNVPFVRTLTVGTRTTAGTVPLSSNNVLEVLTRTGNVPVFNT